MDQLSEPAALAMVLETDVSTSPMINARIGAAGLGLAIVREKVEEAGRTAWRLPSCSRSSQWLRHDHPIDADGYVSDPFRGAVMSRRAQVLFILAHGGSGDAGTRFTPQEVHTVEGRRPAFALKRNAGK